MPAFAGMTNRMFTGIIEATGLVASVRSRGGDRRLGIDAPAAFLKAVRLGDSIACSGVCLTVASKKARRFEADVSVETLAATTAGSWRVGDPLNLEKSLTLSKPLGGHLVSGHVDGVGKLLERREAARSWLMRFSVPAALTRYLASKGSVCIDGVSLTVNRINKMGFEVNIVPHTLRQTTLGRLKSGDAVNIEVDLIARYLERLLKD
jgi:riboflavin synthase